VSVQDQLDRFVADGVCRSHRYDEEYRRLWLALADATRSGKRFRPALVLAAYDAYGGRDGEVAVRVAAAVELLHTALLVHDDVIDGDLVRRGSLNVSGTFVERAAARGATEQEQATFGVAAGVLAGDLALLGASHGIATCGADARTTRRLLDLLADAVHASAAGELADVALSIARHRDRDVGSLADVITVEEHKTAVYSFQLPLQSGAVLAGAPDRAVEGLGEVGRLAGIGFQLVDDLHGVFGDESRTGKSTLSDLREGKTTPLIAHARSTSAWPQIDPHLGDRTLDEERAQVVRGLLVDCGSRDFVERLADSYVTASLRVAEESGLAPGLISELSRLTERIMGSAA
jgi:geranylgeranyl diphosphate synthase, type II